MMVPVGSDTEPHLSALLTGMPDLPGPHPANGDAFSRYAAIYQALLDAQVPIIALQGNDKRPAHNTAMLSELSTLFHIEAALDWSGLNLGAVTSLKQFPGRNPLGFVDLDIDAPGHGLDLSAFTVMVRRQGQTERAHYWFRVPNPIDGIRASHKHGSYDLCTWNTVLPGSVHADGSFYELWIKVEGVWCLWDGEPFSVEMLPVVHPELFRPKKDAKVRQEQVVPLQVSKERTTPPVWVASSGSEATRLKKARFYARTKAWRSISGQGGHDRLFVVVCNLRRYFRLSWFQTLDIVRRQYNPRCVDLDGKPCPWTDQEIEHKWDQAGCKDIYPTLGIADPKAKAKRASAELAESVQSFIDECTAPGGSCTPRELLEAFLVFRSGVEANSILFGRVVRKITGLRSSCPNGKRVYQGICLRPVADRRLEDHKFTKVA